MFSLSQARRQERNPDQPIEKCGGGYTFKLNRIVFLLYITGRYSKKDLANMGFSDDDMRQFAQLIGTAVGDAMKSGLYSDEEVYSYKEDLESERAITRAFKKHDEKIKARKRKMRPINTYQP